MCTAWRGLPEENCIHANTCKVDNTTEKRPPAAAPLPRRCGDRTGQDTHPNQHVSPTLLPLVSAPPASPGHHAPGLADMAWAAAARSSQERRYLSPNVASNRGTQVAHVSVLGVSHRGVATPTSYHT
eukprot:CAMPEP_0204344458 /NCGR_PEP_ID=MMETSP0469-20131031/25646_1 /ASSEMBLY_ACC=CAM_ASM_000384 /TAXON_ID=2969 /ORGANISM="Oxyrrhis marina" /LENGTH=126 /DNA_ID=CAMNT_0051329725 /DNA_START=15 /DNA_END=396 /DNA_ORIENTATION=+